MSRQALGRGLEALIPPTRQSAATGDSAPEEAGLTDGRPGPIKEGLRQIPLDMILPNSRQPRHHMDERTLGQLEISIRAHGILQPILVRPLGDKFEIVAGERRFLAARRAGLNSVPAVVRHLEDRFVLETSLVENLQREDLDPIDEALGYQALLEDLDYTQEKIAERVGKERSTIANALRLLTLPQSVQDLVSRETISAGHARALLSLPTAQDIENAGRYVVTMGLSVRKTEAMVSRKIKRRVQARKRLAGRGTSKPAPGSPLAAIEETLRQRFSTQVRIVSQGKGGRVEVEYYSQAELERLLEIWGAL